METFIMWLGFLGSWLLFAGPIYQAALELQDEDIETERIKEASAHIPKPKSVSVWWWLLPPLKIYLTQRRSRQYRDQYIKSLASEDVESLISFINKATAWLFVAIGGLCLALKETYELTTHLDYSVYIFWAIALVLTLLSIANVILRSRHAKRIITTAK